MKITEVSKICSGQDGAFWGDFLFRFDAKGMCHVYDASSLDGGWEETSVPEIASFQMGEGEAYIPHFNAVVFGTEYAEAGDEFPILYANLYNNYAREADRREGTLCAYRLTRDGERFGMTLKQVITVGFVHDSLWMSEDGKDVRPYGNFVIDTQKGLLHAFTMRDGDHTTRYFTFKLPTLSDGDLVVLTKEDILSYFDTAYANYIQGACCHEGLIYSTEGFSLEHAPDIPPAIRVIDPAAKKELRHVHLPDLGLKKEAEWIDFRCGACYYIDCEGTVYRVEFELN